MYAPFLSQHRRWWRPLGWSLLTLLLVYVVFEAIFFFYAVPLARAYLRRVVAQQSGYTYELDFRGLRVDWVTQGVHVTELSLRPNARALRDAAPRYYLHLPALHLRGADLRRWYRTGELHLTTLHLERPSIQLVGLPDQPPPSANSDEVLAQVYNLLSPVVRRIRIGEVVIENGDIGLFRRDPQTKRFSVADRIVLILKDVQLDSVRLRQSHQLLFADDIELRFDNYHLLLGDSLHALRASKVRLEKNSGRVYVEDFQLTADQQPDTLVAHRTRYEVRVPAFEMWLNNPDQAYFQRRMHVRRVEWQAPSVEIFDPPGSPKADIDSLDVDLYPLLRDYLEVLTVDTLALEAGAFALRRSRHDTAAVMRAARIDVLATDFRIDSLVHRDRARVFNAAALHVAFGGFQARLSDSVHVLRAVQVLLATDSARVVGTGMTVMPELRAPTSKGQFVRGRYEVSLPRIEMQDVNFPRLYRDGNLQMALLQIDSATADLARYIAPKTDSTPGLYSLFSEYFRSIEVDHLRLGHGELRMARYQKARKDTLSAGRIAFDLTQFRLDSTTLYENDRLFYADALDFTLRDYVLRLADRVHQFSAREIGISTRRNEVYARGLRLMPRPHVAIEKKLRLRQRTSVLEVTIPEIRLHDANIKKAYFEQQLRIGEIVIREPEMSLTRFTDLKGGQDKRPDGSEVYDVLSDYLLSVQIDTVRIEEGAVTLNLRRGREINTLFSHTVSAEMTHFYLDAQVAQRDDRLFFADDIDVRVRNYTLYLPDSIHEVTAGQANLSTRRAEIVLTDVRVAPEANQGKTSRTTFSLRVPEIRMQGVDMLAFYQEKKLRLSGIEIKAPAIEIRLSDGDRQPPPGRSTGRTASSKNGGRMPPALREVQFDTLRFEEGSLVLSQTRPDQTLDTLASSRLVAELHQFNLNQRTLRYAREVFFADDIRFELRQASYRLPDRHHQLYAPLVQFSSASGQLDAYDLRVTRTDTGAGLGLTAQVPRLTLEGLFPGEAWKNQRLALQFIRLYQPEIHIAYPAGGAQTSGLPDLATWLPDSLQAIDVWGIHLEEGNVRGHSQGQPPSAGWQLSHLMADLRGLRISRDQPIREASFLYCDEVSVQCREVAWRSADSLYQWRIAQLGFSSRPMRLWVREVTLEPRLDRAAFAQHKGYATDQFSGRIRWAELDGFDPDDLLRHGRLRARRLRADGGALVAYRDKRYPEKEVRRPLLSRQLTRLPWPFTLDTLRWEHAHVTYEEQPQQGQRSGVVTFDRAHLEAHHLSNEPTVIARQPLSQVWAKSYLMGQGALQLHLRLPLDDPDQTFTFEGQLGAMPLAALNPVLEPLTGVYVQAGKADSIAFRLDADQTAAEGNVTAHYADLRVGLSDVQTGQRGGWLPDATAILVNTFVVRSQNPGRLQSVPRPGPIHYARIPHKSVINYCWRALLMGIKVSIGLGDGDQAQSVPDTTPVQPREP